MTSKLSTICGRLAVLLFITLSLFTAALPIHAQTTDSLIGTVYQTTNLRSGPGTQFEIVGQLVEGDQVSIIGREAGGRWLLVTAILDLTLEGWLPAFSLIVESDVSLIPLIDPTDSPSPPSGSAVMVESYGQVNVRSGPGITYGIVAQLDVGDTAEAQARSNAENDWLLIILEEETADGSVSEGWIAYFTVRVTGDTSDLPILTPDATGEELVAPSVLARTRFNVRLHETPALDSPVVVVIPFSSIVTPIARTEDGDWMLIAYQDLTGWGASGLFALDAAVFDALPTQNPPPE